MTATPAEVREAAMRLLREHGPLTTSTLTGMMNRQGVEADSGKVSALLTAEVMDGTVRAEAAGGKGGRGPLWRLTARQVLCWDRPPQEALYEEWARYQADGAPPGTYSPNMTDEWKARWKARMLGRRGGELRTEVRKSTTIGPGGSVQVKLVITEEGQVTMSMNGAASFSAGEFRDMGLAVAEAITAMAEHRAGTRRKAGQ